MVLICLFCSNQYPPADTAQQSPSFSTGGGGNVSSSVQNDHLELTNLFQLISSSLSVGDDIFKCWNFKDEGLPFCEYCSQVVHSLSRLNQDFLSIQLEIQMVIEQIKSIVRLSEKGVGVRTRSGGLETRFHSFRQQVLEGSRRICSTRLITITGLRLDDNDDGRSSVASSDDLSMDGEVSQSGNDDGGSDQSQETGLSSNLGTSTSGMIASIKNDSIIEELLEDATDQNRKADTPQWSKSGENVSFGYVPVDIPVGPEDKYWMCGADDCDFKFEDGIKKYPRRSMSRHILRTHYSSRECQMCGLKFDTAPAMQNHICKTLRHKGRSQTKQCRKCQEVFEDLSKLRLHKCILNVGINNIVAGTSKSVSEGSTSSNTGIETHPNCTNQLKKLIFQCQECSKILSSKATLQKHVDAHTKTTEERKNTVCERCGSAFTPWQLTRHLREVHGEGTPLAKFCCDVANCNKSFPHMTKLKRHQKSHKEKITSVQTIKKQSLSFNEYEQASISLVS